MNFSFFVIYITFSLLKNNNIFDLLEFAKFLEEEGDYQRAILEYKRVFYTLKDTSCLRDSVILKIVQLYEKIGDYKNALKYIEKFGDKNSRVYLFEKGKIYFLLGDYKNARKYWFFSNTLVGWTYLKEKNLKKGELYFGNINLKRKSPFIACGLSALIPGLGKVYADRLFDGLYSFVLHGIVGYLVYDSYKKRDKFPFYIYSSFFVFLYLGNIYGSYFAAKQYNDYQIKLIISQKEIEIGLWKYFP